MLDYISLAKETAPSFGSSLTSPWSRGLDMDPFFRFGWNQSAPGPKNRGVKCSASQPNADVFDFPKASGDMSGIRGREMRTEPALFIRRVLARMVYGWIVVAGPWCLTKDKADGRKKR